MTLVLGFGPFILFAILSRLSADLALWTAFAAAFVVTIRDFVERPVLRLIDGTSLLLFALLALGRGFEPGLSLAMVRALVDAGLTIAILLSLAQRRPFSLQYAARNGWTDSVFRRVNYIISAAWLAAFLGMSLADAAVAFANLPLYVGIAGNVLGLTFAIAFTLRYPATAGTLA